MLFVATALTACGIETSKLLLVKSNSGELQQHLPLAVLKLKEIFPQTVGDSVATALTACGIET